MHTGGTEVLSDVPKPPRPGTKPLAPPLALASGVDEELFLPAAGAAAVFELAAAIAGEIEAALAELSTSYGCARSRAR
jgi:hypothetical protein